MSWSSSDRRSRLPADWLKIRKRIWKRDGGLCQVRLADRTRCLEPASDVDHIKPGDDHRDANLQCICEWHHKKKSSGEGAVAQHEAKRRNRNRMKRVEQHPGLL